MAGLANTEWRLTSETGQISAALAQPRRDVTIAFDHGDQSLYLSVIAPPVANVPGSQERLYTAPLSLLAALLMVPAEFHSVLVRQVQQAREVSEGTVHSQMARAVEKVPQAWPDVVHGREAIQQAVRHAEAVERLALDLAAAGAFTDQGTPV